MNIDAKSLKKYKQNEINSTLKGPHTINKCDLSLGCWDVSHTKINYVPNLIKTIKDKNYMIISVDADDKKENYFMIRTLKK